MERTRQLRVWVGATGWTGRAIVRGVREVPDLVGLTRGLDTLLLGRSAEGPQR